MSTWRERASPIIARVIYENQGKSLQEIRKALRASFPFGIRQYHPYKIWLDECRVQLGLKKSKVAQKGEEGQLPSCEGQKELFP